MATKLGAISSLQKPFKPAALLEAVTNCLEAARDRSPQATVPAHLPVPDAPTALPDARHPVIMAPRGWRKARMTLTTKLAVAMIALVAITVSAIGWLNYRSLEQALLPRVLDRIESQSRLVAADLEAYVAGARGDVAGLQVRRRRWTG